MSDKPLPVENWGWIKLILIPFIVFGLWSTIPILFPFYTPLSLIIGVVLMTTGVIGAVLIGRGYRRLGQILFGHAFLLIFLTTSAKSWFVLIGNFYIWLMWMGVLLAIYILAWFLPALDPDLSAFLWKEQYYPQTKIGKLIFGISVKFLPVAGACGALFGMYATRDGNENFVTLFIAISFFLVSVGLAQVGSYTFWREDHILKDQVSGKS